MSLERAIEEELYLVAHCQPPGPSLEFEARDAIRRVLARHGIRGARIIARCERGGLSVDIQLPPSVPRVRQVRLRIG